MFVSFVLNRQPFIGRVVRMYTLDIGFRRSALYTVRLSDGTSFTIDAELTRPLAPGRISFRPNLEWTCHWRPAGEEQL